MRLIVFLIALQLVALPLLKQVHVTASVHIQMTEKIDELISLDMTLLNGEPLEFQLQNLQLNN